LPAFFLLAISAVVPTVEGSTSDPTWVDGISAFCAVPDWHIIASHSDFLATGPYGSTPKTGTESQRTASEVALSIDFGQRK